VLRAVALVPLPEAPAIIEGIFNLRGTAIPVPEDARRVSSHPDYLAGVAKLTDGRVLMHDPWIFLAQAESETLAEALAEKGGAP
jgi:hypothetical protein